MSSKLVPRPVSRPISEGKALGMRLVPHPQNKILVAFRDVGNFPTVFPVMFYRESTLGRMKLVDLYDEGTEDGQVDCSQSPNFPFDHWDRAPTLTNGHRGLKCTKSSLSKSQRLHPR